jgi:hypothetical protein
MTNDRPDLSSERAPQKKTRQQISENNLRTDSNIWSQVPEWARYLDIMTDWPSVVMWLWLLLKLRGLSPLVNYTDRATAACRRSQCQLLRIEGCHMVSVVDPNGWILGFLYRSRYFFFQVAPQLYSRDWMDPVPDPLLLRKSGSTENGTRTSGSVARNSDH